MGSKTIGLAKLASAANTEVFGDNIAGSIVSFDAVAIKQHLFASNTNLFTEVNANVAGNTVLTISSENQTLYNKYSAHFINSNVTANAGRTVWSQDQRYGLAISTQGTNTVFANAVVEWIELQSGLAQSTPLIINYDGSIVVNNSLIVSNSVNVNLINVSTINAISGNAIFNGNLKIISNGANAALRITQIGTGNVLVIDDATDDTTPLIIDSSGNLVKGANAVYATVGRTSIATAAPTQFHNQNIGIYTWTTNRTFRNGIHFINSISSGVGNIVAGDGTATNLGDILWNTFDSSTTPILRPAAMIFAQSGNVTNERVTGRIFFAVTRSEDTGGPTVQMSLDENGNLKINSGYGSAQNTFGIRAWVNFDSSPDTKANLKGSFVQNSANATGVASNTLIYVDTTPTPHGLSTGAAINVVYKTGDSNLTPSGHRTITRISDYIFYIANTGTGYPTGASGYPGISYRNGTLFMERNSIRNSGAVSSITDMGVGIKIINFQYSMPDVNYCVVGTTGNLSAVGIVSVSVGRAPSTGHVQITTTDTSNVATDFAYNNVIIVR